MDYIVMILPSLLSAACIAAVTWFAKTMQGFANRWGVLEESQRNQIKMQIVEIYERAMEQGYITHMQLDCMLRLYTSYKALHGNTYIDWIVERAKELPLVGEPLPTDRKAV